MADRKTRDLCEDCWGQVHPDQYVPFATRMGECDRCGEHTVFVTRSRLEDEQDEEQA